MTTNHTDVWTFTDDAPDYADRTGYVELDKLVDALKEYTERPTDVRARVQSRGVSLPNHHGALQEAFMETLEQLTRRLFADVSTPALIRRMERAPDFEYDDEATELTRRLRDNGRDWRWNDRGNRVVVFDA